MLSEEEKKERKKEYNRKYNEKNNERRRQYKKEYRENNKEKLKAYYEKNKEKIKEQEQTEARKKTMRIRTWKKYGVESEDFQSLYEYYINCKNCEECDIELTVDKRTTQTTRCLDHDHETNLFRNVLCHSCNIKRR